MKVLRETRVRSGVLAVLVVAAVMAGGLWGRAQGGIVLTAPPPLGPNVTFTWNAVDGATGYTLQAGLSPGNYVVSVPVGNTTTYGVQAPAPGTYYARILASNGVASNEVIVVVTSMFVPPAAPTGLTTYLNGQAVIFAWELGAGGGSPTSMTLSAGSAPGLSDIATLPIAPGTQFVVPVVPPGTYYVRVSANNPGGSATSDEIELVMPVGGACSEPPARQFTHTAFGRYVRFDWTPVPGALGYYLDFATSPGGGVAARIPVAGNASRHSVIGAPLGTFYGKMTTVFACGSQSTGAEVEFTLDGAPPPGPRAANPPPGQRLPLPNRFSVVQRVAARFPTEFRFSCPTEHRGESNRFLYELVRELRKEDTRWGLNWKRGGFGDMSQDIVTYNYGSEPDEGTRQVYIIDIMFGHCGPNPSPGWIDQTEATRNAGTIGVWTLLPYLEAGYPISEP